MRGTVALDFSEAMRKKRLRRSIVQFHPRPGRLLLKKTRRRRQRTLLRPAHVTRDPTGGCRERIEVNWGRIVFAWGRSCSWVLEMGLKKERYSERDCRLLRTLGSIIAQDQTGLEALDTYETRWVVGICRGSGKSRSTAGRRGQTDKGD